MFALNSDIKIGGYTFNYVHGVQISRSVNSISAKAVIKVPVTTVIKGKDGSVSAKGETAKAIKVGDKVEINLGYGKEMNKEFAGYVCRLNLKTPLEIECEDEYFVTRSKSVTLSAASTTLKKVLSDCGLTVGQAVDLTLKNFVAPKVAANKVLDKLKSDYGLNIFFGLDGKVYAIRAFDLVSRSVKYVLRKNVISDDDLRFLKASDTKTKINCVCFAKDGSKIEASIGDDGGAEKQLYFYDVEDKAELKTLAEAELKRYSKDGYDGTIETFLLPYAEPCMAADLVDDVYAERNGKYHITGVETTFGTSGARRKVSIGIAV